VLDDCQTERAVTFWVWPFDNVATAVYWAEVPTAGGVPVTVTAVAVADVGAVTDVALGVAGDELLPQAVTKSESPSKAYCVPRIVTLFALLPLS